MTETQELPEEETQDENLHLDRRYTLHMERPLKQFSTDSAHAYEASPKRRTSKKKFYALVFERHFPHRTHIITELAGIPNPYMQEIVDYGKVTLSASQSERFAVILQRPEGVPLIEHLEKHGAWNEMQTYHAIKQLVNVLKLFSEYGVVHQSINHHTVYYNEATNEVMLTECLSSYPGFNQLPAYETLNLLMCHPAAKGDSNYTGDCYAIGILALCMFIGKAPLANLSREQLLDARLQQGSHDTSVQLELSQTGLILPKHFESLMHGTLTDIEKDQWQAPELQRWCSNQSVASPISRLHRQAANPFVFDDKEYYSRKHLAHDMFRKWETARKQVRINDLSRWANLSLRQPHTSELLDRMTHGSNSPEIMLRDEKLARTIMILDPDGPICFKQFSGNVFGIGTYLAEAIITEERNNIQCVASVIGESVLEDWIGLQADPRDYNYTNLRWSPSKLRNYIRKLSSGFGIERCLYETNPSLTCQSPLLGNYYVSSLAELLQALEHYQGDTGEIDPVDRHIAAFIGKHIDLMDDIKIKTMHNFPYIAKNPQLLMTALLTVAQSESQIASLKNLSAWLNQRMETLLDALHSKGIRNELQKSMSRVAKDGNIPALFKLVADPGYAKRDLYGFHEARQQYRMLNNKMFQLRQQSQIERTATRIGLRISVTIAYLSCAVTMLYVLLKIS